MISLAIYLLRTRPLCAVANLLDDCWIALAQICDARHVVPFPNGRGELGLGKVIRAFCFYVSGPGGVLLVTDEKVRKATAQL